jgi:flagellar biosynthetic protein FliP
VRIVGLVLALLVVCAGAADAAPAQAPLVSINLGGERTQWVLGMRVVAVMTVLSLAPAILILTTSFTRIVIVFAFLRTGMGLQQSPSNQLLIAYALFLTFMIMRPVWAEVQNRAIAPYSEGKIGWSEAVETGARPLRDFMLSHVRQADLALFYDISKRPRPAEARSVDLDVLLCAFVTSELRTAFQMGFALLVPFLVIDIVVACILTSMGMMMLPPTMVSLPFKLLVFVLIDGWATLARALVGSFR